MGPIQLIKLSDPNVTQNIVEYFAVLNCITSDFKQFKNNFIIEHLIEFKIM